MTENLLEYATTAIGCVLAGLIVGGVLVGLASRTRQLDDQARVQAAFTDLRGVVEQLGDSATRALLLRELGRVWDRLLPDGPMNLDAYRQPEPAAHRTDPYVHRILDAYATGDPIDLSGCQVPPDVRGRVRAILAGAAEPTAALTVAPVPWPRRDLAVAVAPADVLRATPVRTGTGDG